MVFRNANKGLRFASGATRSGGAISSDIGALVNVNTHSTFANNVANYGKETTF